MSFTKSSRLLCTHFRGICTKSVKPRQSYKLIAAGVCTLCGIALTGKYMQSQQLFPIYKHRLNVLQAASPDSEKQSDEEEEEEDGETVPDVYQHARERRFYEFASVEIEGERFMTPQDFLESVTDEKPRARVGVHRISVKDLDRILKSTPGRRASSPSLFRKMHQNGIISYSEYLFLLCILTKPKAGFKIAFKMFDTDGNERVDKQEFLVLEEIFRNKTEKSRILKESMTDDGHIPEGIHDLAKIISTKRDDVIDTSLLVHFFGRKGNQTLSYEDFYRFMDNLQTEVLEIEPNYFLTYSHGMPTISEEDFAKVVLRYTDIMDENDCYRKLRERIPEEKGVNFEDFRSFFQFLNHLEDFAVSVKMYAISGKAIGEDEFRRAVKVTTGQDLSRRLVHTLFQLFDKDGDGRLSYLEFIGVMKDRLHRGFRKPEESHLMKHVGWSGFKKCVKQNVKASKT